MKTVNKKDYVCEHYSLYEVIDAYIYFAYDYIFPYGTERVQVWDYSDKLYKEGFDKVYEILLAECNESNTGILYVLNNFTCINE